MAKPKTSFLYRQTLSTRLGKPAPPAWQSRLRGTLLLAFVSAFAYQQTHVSHEIRSGALCVLLSSIACLLLEHRSRPGSVAVTSLEDRADFRFGRSFDELSPDEQGQLLREYQVGTFHLRAAPFGRTVVEPDEREERSRKQAIFALFLGVLTAAALHWTYMRRPAVPLLQVLGSSRSRTFWALVFASVLPWSVVLLRGPRYVAGTRASGVLPLA